MTTLPWLADALRAEGCRVVEEGNWKGHYRSGPFDPIGVLWHHTGSTASYSNPFPTKNTLINGRPDLAGPLCQVGIGYDGVCHVISAGRANHGGASSGWGPFTSSKDQNEQSVGFEIDYDGTQPMSPEQKDAATRCSAAILKRFGHDEGYAARHEETSTTGKWDTGGVTGNQLRAMIKDYLAGGGEDDEDMPKYINVSSTGFDLAAGVWTDINWNSEGSDTDNRVGGKNLWLEKRDYVLMLTARFDPSVGSTNTYRTRTVEVDGKSYEVLASDAEVEHTVSSGETSIQDTRVGWVGSGRALRVRLYSPVAAHVDIANCVILWWPSS